MSTVRSHGGADVVRLLPAGRPPLRPQRALTLGVFAVVSALAWENGGYGLSARTLLAVGVWLTVVLLIGLGLVPRERVARSAVTTGALFGAFTVWTGASAFWAASAERAFGEFDRDALYLGIFALVVLTARATGAIGWLTGLAAAIDAVIVVALGSRFFPSLFPSRSFATFLPNASTRLSFPVGYWNGLAILVALSLPLTVAAAVSARPALARALAVAPIPAITAVVVLASSRGGALAMILGALVLLAAAADRAGVARVLVVGGAGSAAAVLVLRSERAIVDGPLGAPAAVHAGHVAAALLAVVLAATVGAAYLVDRFAPALPSPGGRAGRAAALVVVALVIVAIVAAHPVRRFDEFRQLPPSGTAANFTSAHLTSGSSSGRWQFWTAAVDEWRSAPLAGRGAGSYQSWWAQHASFTYFLKNAHSLYLEVLAEEGLVGVLLLVAAIVVGLLAGVRRARSAVGREREIAAAVLAVAVAFFVTAGIDWTWQLTVVSVVGIVALGLSAASPTGASATRRGPFSLHTAVIAGGLAIAWAILIAQAIPWLASSRLGASQSAAAKGQLSGARKDALDAKAIEPWASSPYLQLALVDELRRDYASARRRIHQAIRRDEDDWAVWFVASRIDREAGRHAAAAADYARARSLNPRSPVFASEGAPK